MSIRVHAHEDDIWVVTPEGRINVPTARSLEEAVNNLLDEGRKRVVVDLGEASYITSLGLKTLLVAQRRARSLGGDLQLAALTPRMREIFEMAGFHEVFAIHTTIADAAESLKRRP
jgi:anti-anti-sigma factor